MATKRQVKVHGKDRWEVDFGKDPLTGEKKRKYVESEKEADKAISAHEKEVKGMGEYWARLNPSRRQLIVGVLVEMEKEGVALNTVWTDWKREKKESPSVLEPTAYEDAVTEWKRRKLIAGKSERYVYHAAADLMKFCKGQERRLIHEIKPGELEKYIDSQRIQKRGKDFGKRWGKSTRRTNMALFSSLWKVAVAKKWAPENIVDRLEPVGKVSRQKRIYPNQTTLNLLAATLETPKTQTYLAPLVLGFFGCMRPEEVTSQKAKDAGLPPEKWFGWQNIDLKNGLVDVSADIAKTGDERVIRLQPCAVKWLKLAKELKCPLPPVDEFRTNILICDMIGLDDWIRDGLRKNCATHLRVIYKNDYDCVKDLGNSVRVMLKAYAELRTPEAVSLEHWMLTPEKVRAYRKTRAWLKVLREAETKLEEKKTADIKARLKAEEDEKQATDASATKPARSANGTAKTCG
jgi:hypothetical protein